MVIWGPYGCCEMVIAWAVFSAICMRRSDRRSCFPLRAVLSVGGCLSLAVALKYLGETLWFYYLLLIVSFVCIWWCYQNSIWQTMFTMGLAYATQYAMYSLWLMICVYLFPDFVFNKETIGIDLLYYAIFALTGVVLWFITRKNNIMREQDCFQPPLVIPFLMIIFVAGYLCNSINSGTDIHVIAIDHGLTAIICLMTAWIGISYITSQRDKIHSIMQQHIIERQVEEFTFRKEIIDDLNIKCHDLKYIIREAYQRDGVTDQAALREIEEGIAAIQRTYHTGNVALDIVLADESKVCDEKGIAFHFMGDGELISFMSDTDIYRLFSNAIDNAIEASNKIPQEQRIIDVKIDSAGPFVSIYFENYYDGRVEFAEGLPITTKGDRQCHGFGVKSIKAIASEYRGELSIRHDEEAFSINVLIPIAQ